MEHQTKQNAGGKAGNCDSELLVYTYHVDCVCPALQGKEMEKDGKEVGRLTVKSLDPPEAMAPGLHMTLCCQQWVPGLRHAGKNSHLSTMIIPFPI